jgi:hypothetical protein
MREDLERIGLPGTIRGQPVNFKATRASFATWLDEAGVSEQVRKRLMGHALRDVTEKHYTVREMEQLARAVAMIAIDEPMAAGTESRRSQFDEAVTKDLTFAKVFGCPILSTTRAAPLPRLTGK